MKGFIGVTDNDWFAFLFIAAILYLQAAHSERNMTGGQISTLDRFDQTCGNESIWDRLYN